MLQLTINASNMMKAFSLPGFENSSTVTENTSDDESDEEDTLTPESPDSDLYEQLTHNEHITCFAHTLQLVIKDGFKKAGQINKVLSKAASLVAHVRKSNLSSDILESEKRLQAANATRWNSELRMIRSLLRIPEESYNKSKVCMF